MCTFIPIYTHTVKVKAYILTYIHIHMPRTCFEGSLGDGSHGVLQKLDVGFLIYHRLLDLVVEVELALLHIHRQHLARAQPAVCNA